ncbi:MAG: thrombospondin type 3 repeat-containing protein [Myxococcota bacterium]|nr:thrombospondin type 3 repeat-containing protein [Myxococcota bacterium]
MSVSRRTGRALGRALATAVLLGACNVALGLEETSVPPPPPPDEDADGVPDELDNCPRVDNPDQANGDGDAFGDACDLCAGHATELNHDEDGDLRGDDCDVCPTVADFQQDEDGDGIGDYCGYLSEGPVALIGFDPFVTVTASWVTTGVRWLARGDTIAPATALSATDPGLQNHDLSVPPEGWTLTLAVITTQPWVTGDRFGVGLVDDEGRLAARCQVVCDAGCYLEIDHGGTRIARYLLGGAEPIVNFQFSSRASPTTAGSRHIACGFTGLSTIGQYRLQVPALPVGGAPVVYGSPSIQLASFIAYGGS